jgi:hypothetical protein
MRVRARSTASAGHEKRSAAPAAEHEIGAHRARHRQGPRGENVGPVADAGLGAIRHRARRLALALGRVRGGIRLAQPDLGIIVDAFRLAGFLDKRDDAEAAGEEREREIEHRLAESPDRSIGDDARDAALGVERAVLCRRPASPVGRGRREFGGPWLHDHSLSPLARSPA